ncbi:hypothetical protein D3C87_1264930 [compost metagenome]
MGKAQFLGQHLPDALVAAMAVEDDDRLESMRRNGRKQVEGVGQESLVTHGQRSWKGHVMP